MNNHKAPMPQTVAAYKALAQRDLELIMTQQREIGQLKQQVNKLQQKLERYKRIKDDF